MLGCFRERLNRPIEHMASLARYQYEDRASDVANHRLTVIAENSSLRPLVGVTAKYNSLGEYVVAVLWFG